MEYPWSNKGKGGKDELSSFGEHGQTVGDMNKSQKTDPQVGIALSVEHKKICKTGSDLIKIHNIAFPVTIFANISVMVSPTAKGHNTKLNHHDPRNSLAKFCFRKTGSDIIKIDNVAFPVTIFVNIPVTANPTAKSHNTTLIHHDPRNVFSAKAPKVLATR